MGFGSLFLAGRFVAPLLIIALFSIFLTFFPLVGTLGFEFSVIIAFVAAFVAVFISSELVSVDRIRNRWASKRFSDLLMGAYVLNLIVLAVPFVVGLLSSVIKSDCYVKEGVLFYLLIPLVTVFFSTSLGLFAGTVFGRKGFLVGSLVLIISICLSLWRLYADMPLYSYNAVFGYFPGPLYDEEIPITLGLVAYRGIIVCWGLLLLTSVSVIHGMRYRIVRDYEVVALVIIVGLLAAGYLNAGELGIGYTRETIKADYLGASVESEHFVIHYAKGSKTDKEIELIVNDHEWRYHQLSKFLDIKSKEKIHSYIYPDKEMRKRLIGAGDTTISNPIHREMHLVYNSFPHPLLKHELTHVLSSEFGTRVLKVSPKFGLVEGLAVAADWNRDAYGYTPHDWSAALLAAVGGKGGEGVSTGIEDVLGYGFWYRPQQISYTLMGSFCRYLIDTFGIGKFKEFYHTGDTDVYGVKLGELIAGWRDFLGSIFVPKRLSLLAQYRFSGRSIFQRRCPRRVEALKNKALKEYKSANYVLARSCLEKAYALTPGDSLVAVMLAYTYYYEEDYKGLAAIIERAGGFPASIAAELMNVQGNALWRQGRREKAIDMFRGIRRELLPSDEAQLIGLKIAAIEKGGRLEEDLRSYFASRDKVKRVAILNDIVRRYPYYGPAYYLLGRIFFSKGDYAMAAQYLEQAGIAGLPNGSFRQRNRLLLGISYFGLGDYDGARRSFERVINSGSRGGFTYAAEDFVERTIWTEALPSHR